MPEPLTRDNRQSWIDTIWQALEIAREECIPEGTEQFDEQWDDICTAMAWIEEEISE